jgi:hypothetical protein
MLRSIDPVYPIFGRKARSEAHFFMIENETRKPDSSDAHPERKGQKPEDSETSLSRRWAYTMLSVRYGMALLSMIWILLPDDLRNLLVNALSR